MPLSERERRILEEIEKNLHKEDPEFAKGVQREAPTAADRRRVRLGITTFVLGFVVFVAFLLTGNILIGVISFATMVSGIVMVAGSLLRSLAPRRPPSPSLQDRANSRLRAWEEKMRRRYRRD